MGYKRTNWIYIIVTVGRIRNSYKLCKREPKSLAGNQFAYYLRIETDEDDWIGRIQRVELARVAPRALPVLSEIKTLVGKTEDEKVIDRLRGRG